MLNILKIILPKHLKNILIFFPVIISGQEINKIVILDFIIGFTIFSLITSVIYLTNDFIDFKIDKINKLKKNNNIRKILKKETIVFLNLFLFPFFFVLIFYDYFSFYLVYYLFLFYIYTFFAKNIKFIDLVLLNSFYIVRLMYGCDLFELDISYWFLLFFSSLFFILSIFKRYIQINVNNINKKNNIIPYTVEDLLIFKNLIILTFLFNILIFVLFIFQIELNLVNTFSSETTFINFNKPAYLLILLVYIANMLRLTNLIYKNKVRKDIFNYVINSPLIIFSSILFVLIILIS